MWEWVSDKNESKWNSRIWNRKHSKELLQHNQKSVTIITILCLILEVQGATVCKYIWLVSKSLEICCDPLSYDINHTYFWKYVSRSFLQSTDTKKIYFKKLVNGRKTVLTSRRSLFKNLETILERINQKNNKHFE